MVKYSEFINEKSKAKEYSDDDLTQYYVSYRYNINDEGDEVEMEGDGTGVLTNLNAKDLEKYIEKSWNVEDISLEKRAKTEGFVSVYILN